LNSPARVNPPQRFLFIDRLRGWAVVVMIETHIVNALLGNQLRHGTFFAVLNFVNGLVAPTFLFCAGFAFAISSHRKWQDFSTFKTPARKYASRLLFILLVGYTLHAPIYSLRRLIQSTDPGIATTFFLVDILQVIAVTLLFLVLLSVILRKEEYLFWTSLFLTLGIISVTPLVNMLDLPQFPVWLRGYISVKYQSQFTLFPWAGFLLTGYLLGYGYMRSFTVNQRTIILKSVWIALAVIIGSILANYLPFNTYGGISFWNSPQFVYLRLGLVVLLGSLLWYFEHRSPAPQKASATGSASLVLLFGKESLLVYSVHLMIVYGRTFSWSFISLFGENRSYLDCLYLYVVLTAAMYLLAYAWSHLKSWNITYAKVLQYAFVSLIGMIFLFSA
jgi:uncharacterized membrane protein